MVRLQSISSTSFSTIFTAYSFREVNVELTTAKLDYDYQCQIFRVAFNQWSDQHQFVYSTFDFFIPNLTSYFHVKLMVNVFVKNNDFRPVDFGRRLNSIIGW